MSHSLPVTHRFSTRRRAHTHIYAYVRTIARKRKRRKRTRSLFSFSSPRLFLPFPTSPPNPALSLLLHAPLHSFFLVKKLISLSLCLYVSHSLSTLRTRKIVDVGSIDPWTWASKLDGRKSKESREPRDTLLRLLFPASTRRFPRSFRSARVPIPLGPSPSAPHFHRFPFVSPLDFARYRLRLLEKLRNPRDGLVRNVSIIID